MTKKIFTYIYDIKFQNKVQVTRNSIIKFSNEQLSLMKVLIDCLGVVYEDAGLLIGQNKRKYHNCADPSDGVSLELEFESTIGNIFELLKFCLVYSNKLLDTHEIKNIWEKILLTG